MAFVDAALDFYERLSDLWLAQRKFSERAFGADTVRGPIGALRHLSKEALEAAEALAAEKFEPGTVAGEAVRVELADCLLLLMDATRRSGFKLGHVLDAAIAKQRANESREWPAPKPDDQPIEHAVPPLTAADLVRALGARVAGFTQYDLLQLAQQANQDATEGKERLPYYKAALALAWDALATFTRFARELATDTAPDSDDATARVAEIMRLLGASAVLAAVGPVAHGAKAAERIERTMAEFEAAYRGELQPTFPKAFPS